MKKLSALLRGITSNSKEDFYCLNCFHWCTTKCKLEKRYDIFKNLNYCYAEGPKETNKIWKCIHVGSSMKVPFIIYAIIYAFIIYTYYLIFAWKNEHLP